MENNDNEENDNEQIGEQTSSETTSIDCAPLSADSLKSITDAVVASAMDKILPVLEKIEKFAKDIEVGQIDDRSGSPQSSEKILSDMHALATINLKRRENNMEQRFKLLMKKI